MLHLVDEQKGGTSYAEPVITALVGGGVGLWCLEKVSPLAGWLELAGTAALALALLYLAYRNAERYRTGLPGELDVEASGLKPGVPLRARFRRQLRPGAPAFTTICTLILRRSAAGSVEIPYFQPLGDGGVRRTDDLLEADLVLEVEPGHGTGEGRYEWWLEVALVRGDRLVDTSRFPLAYEG